MKTDAAGSVLDAMRAYLARVETRAPRQFLDGFSWDMPKRELLPRSLACTSHLRHCVELSRGPEAGLAGVLAAAQADLHWGQTYTAADFGQVFIDNYGWTELFGTRGHFVNEAIAGGFLILGPHVHYPDHHHVAEEIYIPLTGGTLWRMGEEDFRPRAAGEVIFHASKVSHAMRTGEEPLLALYLWRGGDLAQRSTITGTA